MFHSKGILQHYEKCETTGRNAIRQVQMSSGIIGLCARMRKLIVVNDTRLSSHYNKHVDLNTSHPIITLPLLA